LQNPDPIVREACAWAIEHSGHSERSEESL
jgi:hypothetical protein